MKDKEQQPPAAAGGDSQISNGNLLLSKAREMGWSEAESEGAYEYVTRCCYEAGVHDAQVTFAERAALAAAPESGGDAIAVLTPSDGLDLRKLTETMADRDKAYREAFDANAALAQMQAERDAARECALEEAASVCAESAQQNAANPWRMAAYQIAAEKILALLSAPIPQAADRLPAECTECGLAGGPVVTLGQDCAGWMCPRCYAQAADREGEA